MTRTTPTSTEEIDRVAPTTERDVEQHHAARPQRRPRVGTLVLSLALLLMTIAYVTELRESSRLRNELRRAAPASTTQPSD